MGDDAHRSKISKLCALVARSRLQNPPDHATDMTLRAIPNDSALQ